MLMTLKNREILMQTLKKDEGYRKTVYACPSGKLTIGYGRNLEDNGIDMLEAENLLHNDVVRINRELNNKFDWYKDANEVRQSVLIMMAFQLGVNGLFKFLRFLEHMQNENYELASVEMLRSNWAKQTPPRAKRLAKWIKDGRYE